MSQSLLCACAVYDSVQHTRNTEIPQTAVWFVSIGRKHRYSGRILPEVILQCDRIFVSVYVHQKWWSFPQRHGPRLHHFTGQAMVPWFSNGHSFITPVSGPCQELPEIDLRTDKDGAFGAILPTYGAVQVHLKGTVQTSRSFVYELDICVDGRATK